MLKTFKQANDLFFNPTVKKSAFSVPQIKNSSYAPDLWLYIAEILLEGQPF